MPEMVDDDGDPINLSFDFGGASNFLRFDDGKLIIEDISSGWVSVGFFILNFNLDDSDLMTKYNIMLFVFKAPDEEIEAE